MFGRRGTVIPAETGIFFWKGLLFLSETDMFSNENCNSSPEASRSIFAPAAAFCAGKDCLDGEFDRRAAN
jgi:hypothetical protein